MKYKNILTKEFLIEEYTNKKKSAITISRKLNTCFQTIYYYLKKYNIKMRTSKDYINPMQNKQHKEETKEKIRKKALQRLNNNKYKKRQVEQVRHVQNLYLKTKKKLYKKCEWCEETYLAGYEENKYSHKRRFCSRKCQEEWRANKFSGKNHPLFGKKGKDSPMYGKKPSNGKRIYFKGVCMRSSWETLFAQFLDLSDINYQYESKRFYMKEITYCPDFYIPEFDCYIEIKGWWRDNGKKRFELFKRHYPNINIKVLMKPELQELGVL